VKGLGHSAYDPCFRGSSEEEYPLAAWKKAPGMEAWNAKNRLEGITAGSSRKSPNAVIDVVIEKKTGLLKGVHYDPAVNVGSAQQQLSIASQLRACRG
jgi:hypothetical protein